MKSKKFNSIFLLITAWSLEQNPIFAGYKEQQVCNRLFGIQSPGKALNFAVTGRKRSIAITCYLLLAHTRAATIPDYCFSTVRPPFKRNHQMWMAKNIKITTAVNKWAPIFERWRLKAVVEPLWDMGSAAGRFMAVWQN